jgi:NAD(P)-dependent dehydrogenase (short-subunit alcohol dehydrogenase family)
MIAGLHDKVIIITGGAHGIGQAYAHAFARAGAKVAIADIDQPGAERAAGEIAKTIGVGAIHESPLQALHVDVSDEASTKDMAARTLARFGRIDALINNAAVFSVTG